MALNVDRTTPQPLALSILYRGPLSSCNYGCPYCPFAKRQESHAQLAGDRAALARFVDWVTQRPTHDQLGVFFTPWGEAITRPAYRQAMVHLSRLPQVRRVAVQTNLSVPMDWVAEGDPDRMGFWATYHPGEVQRQRFLKRVSAVQAAGARLSVGVVGLREHFGEIAAMRAALPPSVYLWINAYDPKTGSAYYTAEEVAWLSDLDPLFPLNIGAYASGGQACGAGHRAISVDGAGQVRRCHFIPTVLGNLYEPGIVERLQPALCAASQCRCHIGYVHLEALRLDQIFGAGLLERDPTPMPDQSTITAVLARAEQLRVKSHGQEMDTSDNPFFGE